MVCRAVDNALRCSLSTALVVCKKTSKAPVTPGLRPGYDLPETVKCENRGQVVEITYDWSQRSWPGDRQGKMSCNKVDGHVKTYNLRFQIVSGRR